MFRHLSLLGIFAIGLLQTNPALACTNPVGVAGDMTYNDSEHVMQWCDGTNWNGVNKSPYIPNAVNFDGATRLTNGPLTGTGISRKATISAWFNLDTTAASRSILGIASALKLEFQSSSGEIRISNDSGGAIYSLRTTNYNDATGKWHHILISFDLDDPTKRHIYLNDVSDLQVINYTASDLDFNANTAVGSNSGGGEIWPGKLADVWFDADTYIDLSIEENRRQFIDANGWPVDLGSDGSKATGAVPDIYMSGDTATWHTNKGTGGGFTENGALTDAMTAPGANLGPTDGLYGWWKLDETSGTTAFDSSGNGNNGSMVGGLNAGSHNIDGVVDTALRIEQPKAIRITHAASLATPPEITVSAWVRVSDTNFQRIIQKGLVNGGFQLEIALNNSRFDFKQSAGTIFSQAYTFEEGQWYHLAASLDDPADEARLYVNGVNIRTGTYTDSFTISTEDITFTTGNSPGIRAMDDVRLYNRVLSDAEVTELYETGFPCQNPAAERDGTTTYNTTHDVPQYCNLREWKSMAPTAGDGGAGCTNPAGVAGDTFYNSTHNVMTYCEGDTWRAMGSYGP